MKLIVGLGNPGSQYETTRHNAGWMALDRLAHDHGARFRTERRFRGDAAELDLPGVGRVLLLKPLTFMNLSGESVQAAAAFYKIEPADILVITDDYALPLGFVRVRARGSAGGHNGLKSIIAHLNTNEFPRVRIGVGAPTADAIGHVLGTFRKEEWPEVDEALVLAVEATLMALRDGVGAAMNRYNVRASPPPAPDGDEADAESFT
ncbi:MAG TPA: aminoacyl-tRNA hydrolase [Armatimonadota bacterium]